MIKIVLDTNAILSASLFGGMIEQVVDLVIANKLQLFISSSLVEEVDKKLDDFQVDEAISIKVMAILGKGIMVSPNIRITACRDPEDNFLLELVESSKADYLITRDKDLLELPGAKWEDTRIVKPEAFLVILRGMKIL
ncbi:putative toxin-antitoxin system toxin component, PIN family [Candidatus Daviesbacteria bacterium]|nr:putative toxin-antitoxin system toxin component, PIN family [Candidatus Daviesbacteria bacterium]